ncbi:hypothetical protein ACFO25_19540 [Paenactinomyces guangxiensis]
MKEMPIAPIYYYSSITMKKDKVKNVIHNPDGTTFKYAYIEE